jgi:hypothetical protein
MSDVMMIDSDFDDDFVDDGSDFDEDFDEENVVPNLSKKSTKTKLPVKAGKPKKATKPKKAALGANASDDVSVSSLAADETTKGKKSKTIEQMYQKKT